MPRVGEVLLELPPPIERRVARRLNRFVVELESGERAYINNTGRLLDLLVPGRRCYCLPKPSGSTGLRLIAVEEEGGAALVDTRFQMAAFERALELGKLPWAQCRVERRNPKLGSSTLDYLLECGGERVYAELKSAALRVGCYAAYPDCPSLRGRRHIAELAEHARRGGKALIVFVAAIPGVCAFKPHEEGDPEIPKLLREAASTGVTVKSFSLHYEPSTSTVVLDNPEIPVIL